MSKYSNKIWVYATAILTLVLIAIVFPILRGKFGTATAVLGCLGLAFGMALYYLRGVWLSRSAPRKGHEDGANGV
jgi:hypothetical protein